MHHLFDFSLYYFLQHTYTYYIAIVINKKIKCGTIAANQVKALYPLLQNQFSKNDHPINEIAFNAIHTIVSLFKITIYSKVKKATKK